MSVASSGSFHQFVCKEIALKACSDVNKKHMYECQEPGLAACLINIIEQWKIVCLAVLPLHDAVTVRPGYDTGLTNNGRNTGFKVVESL